MTSETEALRDIIEEMCRQRVERIQGREFGLMTDEFYAPDAVLMPSGRAAVTGIDAIRAYWESRPERGLVALSLFTSEVQGSGDLAYELGRFSRTLRPRHGAPFQDNGKFMVVYRRGDVGWRAVAEMFNADATR